MNSPIHSSNRWIIIWLILLAETMLCLTVPAQSPPPQRSRTNVFTPRQPPDPAPAILKMHVEDGAVTAEIQNSPMQNVLQELAERTGIIFEVRYSENSLISLRLDGIPLPEAIKRIAADNNTIFFYSPGVSEPERITLVQVFPRENPSPQPGIVYLGTGTITKTNTGVVTFDQAIKVLAESTDIEEREWAVEFLIAERSEEAAQALMKAVSDPAPEIRIAAIQGLAIMEARSGLQHVLSSLNDSHPEVRRNAAIAVGALGNAENLADLQSLTADADAGVVAAAEMAMTKLSATLKK